jgi:hypothetical protein
MPEEHLVLWIVLSLYKSFINVQSIDFKIYRDEAFFEYAPHNDSELECVHQVLDSSLNYQP